MRVLEPKAKMPAKHAGLKKGLLIIVGAVLLAGGITWSKGQKDSQLTQNQTPANQKTNGISTLGAENSAELMELNNDQLHALYLTTAYPNTQQIQTPPFITGNPTADERIRSLAEARGYHLVSGPIQPITKINGLGLSGDDLLQERAAADWAQMQKAAAKDGLTLNIVSAYRSIEFQRKLFLSRLRAHNISDVMIASGHADSQIIATLTVTAPPGYSRHHTGYTMDLACHDVGLYAFLNTDCFAWLKNDNYKNTKLFGFIPSYPEGASLQGPEPEPWEYVWVGKDRLIKH